MTAIKNITFLIAFLISFLLFGQVSRFDLTSFQINNNNNFKTSILFKNNLIYLTVILASGDSLTFYIDTGGKNFLYKSGINKLQVRNTKENIWVKSGLENIFIRNNVPLPKVEQMTYINEKGIIEDGMLGREWFADKTWRINYKEKMFLEEQNVSPNEYHLIAPIYFLKDSLKNSSTNLPRIEVIIENDTLSFLFDTGAQVYLSNKAQKEMNEQHLIATSFISSFIFDKWKVLHPEWKIITKGDNKYKEDIIEVPKIKIGDNTIRAVWFTKRDKQNFTIMSKLFMDKEIVGAVGGNALSLLGNIIVDYKNEKLFIDIDTR